MKFRTATLTALAVIALLACARDPKPVQDAPANFNLESLEVRLKLKDLNMTPIRRDDPMSGPQIQIVNAAGAVNVERKLLCGPVTLQGRKLQASDWTALNFRLAEEEFPGLNKMPLRAACKLQVIMTNNVGSTNTLNMPVTLAFDSPAPLQIKRAVMTKSLVPAHDDGEVPLESYVINNEFDYPVGVCFKPRREAKGYVHYDYFANQWAGKAYADGYHAEPVILKTRRIELSGPATQQQGDLVSDVRFIVPPHQSVTVTSYGRVPSNLAGKACFPNSWGREGINSGHCRTMTGFHATEVSDEKPTKSLALWRSFEISNDDQINPAFLEFKEDLPFPGTEVDPAVMNKMTWD